MSVLLLSGCVTLPDPEVSQDLTPNLMGVVNPTQSLGQSLEIRRDNFDGITFWIDTGESGQSPGDFLTLKLSLFTYPEPLTKIYDSTVMLEPTSGKRAVTIALPKQPNSANHRYLISLTTDDEGGIKIFGADEDVYYAGQAYLDSQVIKGDLAFSTSYDYDLDTLIDDIKSWLQNAGLILPLIGILILPGLLFLNVFRHTDRFDIGQLIGLSVGLSLAFTPLTILWITTIGLTWNKTLIYFLMGFLASSLLIIFARKIAAGGCHLHIFQVHVNEKSSTDAQNTLHRHDIKKSSIPLALIGIFLLTLAVRFIMVRDLAAPPWVDSVHHALITRIIVENGSLPQTYLPYLDIEPTFYHPGFHSQLATFNLLSGLDLPLSMILFGQVINALTIYAVYSMAVEMTKNQHVGLLAALITGLFTPMPAYYTSWGRYTQLSGLLILPTAYIFLRRSASRSKNRVPLPAVILSAIAIGGLFLTHYRVTAFLILLIASEIIVGIIYSYRKPVSLRKYILPIFLIALISFVLVAPWLIQAIPNTFLVSLKQPLQGGSTWFQDFSWRYLNAALGKQALALAGLGLIWGLINKRRFAFVMLIWVGLLLLLANMSVLGLPGGGFINTTSVEITLFIPISILAGYFIVEITKSWKVLLPNQMQPVIILVISFIMVAISYVGVKNIIPILNPVTFLAREADIEAIEWLRNNLPEEGNILINPFLWGYGLYAGNDGGYWITPLIGKNTIPPPALYGLAPENEVADINKISQYAIDNGENSEALYSFLKANDVNYIFLGARGGPISSDSLNQHPDFIRVYGYKGVEIYKVLP